MTATLDIDLFDLDLFEAGPPHDVFRRLREEAPVCFLPEPGGPGYWAVTGYDDVFEVSRHPQLFGSNPNTMIKDPEDGGAGAGEVMLNQDPPRHTQLRKLVNRGFTPRQIQRLEPRIRALVAGCLAELRSKPEFDLVSELNIPLPVTVIAEMLGVEPGKRHVFKHWSDVIIAGATGSGLGNPLASGVMNAMAELRAYLRPIVKERRRQPADDLISILVEAEVDGEGLSDYEIFLFVLLLLVAGNETTTNLLGNAVDALLAHPEQLARVVAEPALIAGLVEETLRYDGPVQFITRRTTRDFAMHGQTLPVDSMVVVLLGSANRDERRFTEPDRFDVTRDTRGHVAFGFGAHFCLGASLARLEARGALEALVPELPRLARVRPEREFLDSYLIRGRARLDLRAA